MVRKNKQKSKKQRNNNGQNKQVTRTQQAAEASIGRKILRALGGASGGALGLLTTGNIAGAAQGARYGYNAGNQAATIMGMGAYTIKQNSLSNKGTVDSVPYMHSNDQNFVVRHTEFLGNVISSGTANTFNISAPYPLNPGLSGTFPWLSSIAENFQEYSFRGLAFFFKSTSADAIASSTNTTLGTVMMGTQYNPIVPAFAGKLQMLNEYYSNDCKPSDNMVHLIECDPAENPYKVQYVRAGAVPTGASVQNYDLGTFYIATAGFQGTNVVCGELYVTYEVELKKPIPFGLSTQPDGFHLTATTGITTAAPFGTNSTFRYNSWFGFAASFASNVLTIPAGFGGTFMVYYSVVGSSAALGNVNLSVSNLTSYSAFGANGSSAFQAGGSVTNTISWIIETYTINQSDIPSTITFSGGTLPTSPTSMDLIVVPIPGSTTPLSF